MNRPLKPKYLPKNILAIVLVAVLSLSLSCKKKDEGPEPASGKNVKLTITINGAIDPDFISFVAVGGTYSNPQNSTVWKLNSATQNNQQGVALDRDDFTSGTTTHVIESVAPLDIVNVGIQCLAFNHTYTVSYKAEINGKVITNDENVTVAENKDYSKDYSY